MRTILFLVAAAILNGCAATPPLGEKALQQVHASIAQDDGAVKFANIAIWVPNSREIIFGFTTPLEPSVKGVAVITEKSFLFQQWGGSTGLTTIKRILLAEIRDASMITRGTSGRIVIRTSDDNYDSFAVSDAAGMLSIPTATAEMYEVLSALLQSRP